MLGMKGSSSLVYRLRLRIASPLAPLVHLRRLYRRRGFCRPARRDTPHAKRSDRCRGYHAAEDVPTGGISGSRRCFL